MSTIKLINKDISIIVPGNSYRYKRQGIITECFKCKAPIYVSLFQLKKYKIHYCSKQCVKNTISRTCSFCNKEFYITPVLIKRNVGKYCSRNCASKAQTANGKIERQCKICGKSFIISKSVVKKGAGNCCSRDCYRISISGKNNVNWNGGYYQYYGYGFNKMVKEVQERDIVCQCCGRTNEEELKLRNKKLHVHHIKPYNTFISCNYGCKFSDHPEIDQYNYENLISTKDNICHPNHKENGILLCSNCHAAVHKKINNERKLFNKRMETIL